MEIQEKFNDDYQVGEVKMNCDNTPSDIDDIFIKRNFFGISVGSAGSGKTNLLIWLLTNRVGKGWNQKFQRIYYISPSMDTIDKDVGFAEERVYTEFSSEILQEILAIEAEFSDEARENEEPIPQKLVIIDDCITEINKPKHLANLMRLIYNRRHLGFSILITAQKYNMLPKKLRVSLANKGFLFLFKTQNKKEIDDIASEIIDLNKNELHKLLDYVFPEDEKYNFLYVRFDKPLSQQFHKCFNRLKLKFAK